MFFLKKKEVEVVLEPPKSKDLIIIGAGGWGREVYGMAKQLAGVAVKGFLDNNPDAFAGLVGEYPPILSSIEDYVPQENDVFFCAMGDPVLRGRYSDYIQGKGGVLYTIISPVANVSAMAVIGEGSFIDEYSVVSDNVVLGKNCIVQRLSTLGHDVCVGDNVTIGAYVFVGGNTTIGSGSIINVKSTIIRGLKIGSEAVVGVGSVVMKNVEDGAHVFGYPARVIPMSEI